jgi:hypothetical protein
MPYLLFPYQPILSPNIGLKICRWYVSIRLDTDPRFTAEDVMRAFEGAECLEIEAWQAEYGTSDLKILKMFEGVRGVKKARVSGSVGARYCRWLEACLRTRVGEAVGPFLGEEGGKGYDIWNSGNR